MIKLSPIQKYQQDLTKDDFLFDAAQENAVKHLQRLYEDLQVKPVAVSGFKKVLNRWKKVYSKPEISPVKGLYFWGGVGRGKTYLVDTFYDCLPFENKMRVHFHRFMHRVHQELKGLTGQSDPLKIIAKKFAQETCIICFDEFFVSDITGAMILGTLFEELFAHNVTLVATSNIIPDQLYRNGLQRERFLPAIKLINEHTDIVNVDAVFEDFLELHLVSGDLLDCFDGGLVCVTHFDRVSNRTDCLFFQSGGASIPELRTAENSVVADGRVTAPFLIPDTDAELCVPAPAFIGMMTAGTADGSISGETGIEVELATQFNFGAGQRVFSEALNLSLTGTESQGEGDFQHLVVFRIVEPFLDFGFG